MQTTPLASLRNALSTLPRRVRRLAIVVVVLLALGGALWASLTQEPMRAAIWQGRSHLCGTLAAENTHPTQQLTGPATVRQAEDCFMNGYTHCQAVSLKYASGAVDAFTTDTFVVEPAEGWLAGCALADAWSSWVSTRTYSGTNRCSGVAQEPDGLHIIGCAGGGDIIIPSP